MLKLRQRSNADPGGRKIFGETRCKIETNIETVINKQSDLYSDGTEKWSDIECKGPRTVIASRCQNSLVNYFDTRKLVEKKMPEFVMIELFRNAREFYQRIQDIGQTN